MNVTRFVPLVVFVLVAPGQAAAGQHDGTQHTMAAGSPGLVEHVREVTRPFRHTPAPDYEQFLGCVSGPQQGAMGVHFVNFSLVDGSVEPEQPEALVYERRDGGLNLVAVEYIVPVAAWQGAEPPVIEGQLFQFVDSPNRFGIGAFYELHVWAWRPNADGAFADWNTRVSCESQ